MCDHIHEQTSRYDFETKVLSFLLFCPVCGTEKVVESLTYEPRYKRIYPVPDSQRSGFVDVPNTEPLPLAA